MKQDIENSTALVRQLLLERGISEFPKLARAMRYQIHNALGEVSEAWNSVEFESFPVGIESFGEHAYTNKHYTEEYCAGEFLNADCEPVRYSVRFYHYLSDDEKDTLRAIGKLQTISEPATEYEALIC